MMAHPKAQIEDQRGAPNARRGSDQAGLWPLFASELVGTALLVLVGLSVVIFDFGRGTPMAKLIPNEALWRLLTGFLFGGAGAMIALSRVGKVSGAHINPIVSLGFYLVGKLDVPVALGYIVAQLVGGVLGALPLLAWGAMGRSLAFGATAPGPGYSIRGALLGEVITTFAMVALLYLFLSFRESRPFTPALSRFSIPSWSASRPPYRARVPILRAALVRRQYPVPGTVAGSTGLVPCWACWQRSLRAAM